MPTVLHITDCHLLAEPDGCLLDTDTAATLDAVLACALRQHRPDLLLATGDLAHDCGAAGYERFARIVRARYPGPVLALPGNHDFGAALRDTLGAHGMIVPAPELAATSVAGWQIIGLDSHEDHAPGARIGDAAIAALRAQLAAADGPVLLALHHPLVPVGTPWLDKDCPAGGASLLEWLAEQSPVRGIVYGHVHQQVTDTAGPCAVLGTPSTCFQFAPGSQRFALDARAPGWRWLFLAEPGAGADGAAALETQVVRLPAA